MRAPKTIFDQKDKAWDLWPEACAPSCITYRERESNNCGLALRPDSIEKEFSKKGRQTPSGNIVTQGDYDCLAASLAMALNIPLKNSRELMIEAGWECDSPNGATNSIVTKAARLVGIALIKVKTGSQEMKDDPCLVCVPSLNVSKMGHAVYWNGNEILDPNYDKPGRNWYGCEWAPWTIGASSRLWVYKVKDKSEWDEIDAYHAEIEKCEKQRIESLRMQIASKLNE